MEITLSWSASTKPACHAIDVSRGMAIFKQDTFKDPPLNSILFNLSAMYQAGAVSDMYKKLRIILSLRKFFDVMASGGLYSSMYIT